ncbi:MAG: GMC family oxidoreductase, partial [Cyanobacteria bacterium Co-bin13]|nr:GMC family oxidoreductase [Cyanobacteria bacterium Co-bin13]
GWPITRQDLDPYYEKAHAVCQSGPYTYRPEDWGDETAQPFPFNSSRLKTQMFQFGPADAFLQDYRREIEQSQNVTLCTYATALELETDDLAQTVTHVRVGTLEGNQFWVSAKFVILAVGALETARLLLLSNSVQKTGLGNGHDLVGRFLMDHPVVRSGLLIPQHRRVINALSLYDMRFVDGKLITAKAALTESTMRQEKLMNICAAFYPRPASAQFNLLRTLLPKGKRYRSSAVQSALALKQALRQGKIPPKLLDYVGNMVGGLDDLLYFLWRQGYAARVGKTYHFDRGGWSKLDNKVEAFSCFEVINMTEQSPDPANRIVLTAEQDALGCRKPQLHWRMNDLDFASIQKAQEIFREEFSQAGLGQLKIERDHGLPYVVFSSIHHSSGTTRMHESPTQGVVDANCKVHGVSNLFVASSSVFPTIGYANPTLTIVAIAIRVADQIRQKIAPPSIALK